MDKKKKSIYKKWWFWVIVFFVIGGIGTLIDGESDSPNTVVNQPTSKEIKEATEKVTEKEAEPETETVDEKVEYIALADTFEYKDLERNPDEYKGEIAKFTGQVIQVSEGFGKNVSYRVNINKNPEYSEDSFLEDEWIDTIYVSYKRAEGESRVLEDDIITIYGELNGMETYTSVMAGRISIPSIKAKYIEIEE